MLSYLRKGVLRRYLRVNALRRGVLGGSRPWLAILVLGLIGRGLGKVSKRGEAPIAFREALEPGQSLLITHLAPRRRSQKS